MSDADAKAHAERVERTKDVLERQLADRRKEAQDRRERRMQFNKLLANPTLDAATKERMRAEFDTKERELMREARRRISPSDFETLAVIGRGAFGEVMVVRSRDDGHIYAMKKMLKDAMILKNQTGHVMAERTALSEVSEIGDWVVRLHFSFQVRGAVLLA
jgi:serine/threonine kinase 38